MASGPARACALAGRRLEARSRSRPRRRRCKPRPKWRRSARKSNAPSCGPRSTARCCKSTCRAGERVGEQSQQALMVLGRIAPACMFEPTSTSTTLLSFARTPRQCCNCAARTIGIIRCDSCASSPMWWPSVAHRRQHRAGGHARASGDLRSSTTSTPRPSSASRSTCSSTPVI